MKLANSLVNMILARNMNRTDEQILEIDRLQKHRGMLESQMKALDPESDIDALKDLRLKWVHNELDLQEVWGFPMDTSYHKEFLLPHCKCPTYDNTMLVGTSARIRNKNCPYHGQH